MDSTKKEKRNRPFTVPENYFEDFHHRLMQELPEKETRNEKVRYLAINRIRQWSAAAAITFMIIVSATALYQYSNRGTIETTLTETERDEYIESIFDNYTIDEYNIYNYLTNYDPID